MSTIDMGALRENVKGLNGKHKPTFTHTPIVVCMADVQAQPIDWLWENRFVAGAINLLAGPGGIGKSTVMYDAVARVTRGLDWPDGSPCEQGSALLISGEDDPARVIRPRLDEHGADVSRVHLLRAVTRIDEHGDETEIGFTLEDVEILRKTADQIDDLRLIVIDPIGSFIGGRTDASTDNAVRAVLVPVSLLAERNGAAVVLVAHHRKAAGITADELVLGSRAFTALSRAVWHVFKDPADDERRLMLAGKSNLARSKNGLAFTIANGAAAGHVRWEPEPVEQTADAFVQEQGRPGPEPESQTEAIEWLKEALSEGAIETNKLKKMATEAGVSWRTARRAKGKVGIKIERNSFSKKYEWRLLKPAGTVGVLSTEGGEGE